MNKTLLALTLVGFSVSSFAEQTFLEELAEAQKVASADNAHIYSDSSKEGMEWRYLEPEGKSLEFNVDDEDDDFRMLFMSKVSGRRFAGSAYGLHDGEKLDYHRMRGREYFVLNPARDFKGFNTLLIESQSGPCRVWLGKKDAIDALVNKHIKPELKVYTEKWLPLIEKYDLSGEEVFFELEAVRGKTFALTPRAAAEEYAKKCATSLKKEAVTKAAMALSWKQAEAVRTIYLRDRKLVDLKMQVSRLNQKNIVLALKDINQKYPEQKLLEKYGQMAAQVDQRKTVTMKKLDNATPDAEKAAEVLLTLCREITLANPLLDDMEVMAISRGVGHMNLRDEFGNLSFPGRIERGGSGAVLGAPSLSTHSIVKNIQSRNASGWNSSIVKLSNLRKDVETTSIYTPEDDQSLISNARLHWDADRVAFSMGSHTTPMGLYELDVKSGKAKQLSPPGKDHFFDPCYLPDGNIIVMSTAVMTALACEGGSHMLANVYQINPDDGKIRQLGIDQENSYHASVQEDGRVLYIRYEYTDAAHYFMRIMMNMNPDGTNQREIYGSNSVWPTAMFYPQQVPGHPNLYTAVVAGHHGPTHMGPLVLFDVSKGRREADGAVQFIGMKDRPVEAVMVDRLYSDVYPKFMYSTPLDPEYHLTMMKPSRFEPWGLYLVDCFDNMTLIHQPENEFLAWPQVYKKKKTPPMIPSRVRSNEDESTIYVQDIYEGPGLEGITRGDVKELAVYAFHYGYKSAASHRYIGHESGWDARYLLGTVPVHEDGSVMFKTPSLMPITMMPLDEDGMGLQKMRTWMNPQPGEILSCVGCHETADQAPIPRATLALKEMPSKIQPWFGEARPYSFVMEVQPVLDKYCVSCHAGDNKMDLRNSFSLEEMLNSKKYSTSYEILQRYVRRNGPESNPELMVPMEWHASSSTLIQMMGKGHHGVQLDNEAKRRLTMWADLNAPFHAAFHPSDYGAYGDQVKWRRESIKKYAGLYWDPENQYKDLINEFVKQPAVEPIQPAPSKSWKKPKIKGWPFEANGKQEIMVLEFGEPGRQIKSYDRGRAIMKTIDGKEHIEFVKIPAGNYVMGSDNGYPNEKPREVVIKEPFWMSVAEISNSQMQTFEPMFDSKFADMPEKDQVTRGVSLYTENQPAVRVSHGKAEAFCAWLSRETAQHIKLPTEEQWEWAARAGSDEDTWYGSQKKDFGKYANLSDKSHGTSYNFTRRKAPQYFQYLENVNDGQEVTAPVKSYQPNAWGLYDMIGNAEEWTRSNYDGQENVYTVKGGSWFDMPKNATSATRWGYHENIRLPDLGFRVIIEE